MSGKHSSTNTLKIMHVCHTELLKPNRLWLIFKKVNLFLFIMIKTGKHLLLVDPVLFYLVFK